MVDDIYKVIVQQTDEHECHLLVDAADLDPVRRLIYHAFVYALYSKVKEARQTLFELEAEDAWNADDPLLVETRMLIEGHENRTGTSISLAYRVLALEYAALYSQVCLAYSAFGKRRLAEQYSRSKSAYEMYPQSNSARYTYINALLTYWKDHDEARRVVDRIKPSLRQRAYKAIICFGGETIINVVWVVITFILFLIPELRWPLFFVELVGLCILQWIILKKLRDGFLFSQIFGHQLQLVFLLIFSLLFSLVFHS
jgi:hypothetical protein